MANAKRKHDWDVAAPLLAVMVNANRDPQKTRPVSIADCHPYEQATGSGKNMSVSELRSMRPALERLTK